MGDCEVYQSAPLFLDALPQERKKNEEPTDMEVLYSRMFNAVSKELIKNGVSVDEVASMLKIDLNKEEFKHADGGRIQSVAGLILTLCCLGYMPFYYSKVLEMLVDEFAEECKPDLDDYKCNYLQPYLKGCVEYGPFKQDSLVHLYLEVDRKWDTLEKLDVHEVTKTLAAIVGVPEDKLVIECILEESKEDDESEAKSCFLGAIAEATGRFENCPPTNTNNRQAAMFQHKLQDEEKEKEADHISSDDESAPLPVSSNERKCYHNPCSLTCSKPLNFPPLLAEPKVRRVNKYVQLNF